MKVTLALLEDAELRAVIKEGIEREVRSIVREELRSLVQEEIKRKVRDEARLADAAMIKSTVEKQCASMVRELLPPGALTKEHLVPLVDAAVDRIFQNVDFTKLVDKVASAKLARMAEGV